MEPGNQTDVHRGFILLGLSDDPDLQSLLFCLFLIMYLVTILGNLLIILAVISDSHLHTPMYFFLSQLSFTDICISTCTVPKMLLNIQTRTRSITYVSCLAQIGSVLTLGAFENFLLAAMAYDRYVAICHPLRYAAIMNPRLCGLLVGVSLILSLGDALLHTLMVLPLAFCSDRDIPHFFCEFSQVIKLACSDTLSNNILFYLMTCIFGGIPVSGILFSYTQIISSVLKIPSAGGKLKVFATCGPHILVVFLFYGTAFGVYITSSVIDSPGKTAVASVMYIIVPQMMNPFIYSLRNKDMKGALRKLASRTVS
ncbi:olfactory receptor 7G2-like [Suncus etruscus]|uniref:olfactory receptor 7G2-like n=1 Tax=Suncus etruscus TaxID=109475 RepID=UPI00211072FF|nr:olfactory receptor 7G2-like [Suncus etruscus]